MGNKMIKLSKQDWMRIGMEQGFMKSAQFWDIMLNVEHELEKALTFAKKHNDYNNRPSDFEATHSMDEAGDLLDALIAFNAKFDEDAKGQMGNAYGPGKRKSM